MEYIAYVVWVLMGIMGILIASISVVSEKVSGKKNPLATMLFSSGIYFTVFMLVSSIVIYLRTGPSIYFIIVGFFFFLGLFMVTNRLKRRLKPEEFNDNSR